MSVGADGLVASDLPRDKNQHPVPVGDHIQIVKDNLTGAGGAGDSFAISVPDGAFEVRVYVLDSSNAKLNFTLDDIQDTPIGALLIAGVQPFRFGCSGHATIAGSVATGDLADAATATAICIFTMGKARG